MPTRLFSPVTLRGLEIPNRIAVAPMCQYSAAEGVPGDWHRIHLGQFAQSGPGLIIAEATAVVPEGRISPGCPGLWNDEQERAWSQIVALCRAVGTSRMGIQLAHAGRKAATCRPWEGQGPVPESERWPVVSASADPYAPDWIVPHALDQAGIDHVVEAFADAARRAGRAGFDLIEIHAAHGYLLHQFLSPLSNRRTDAYGGTLENRMRLTLRVFDAVRGAFAADKPVILRLSATDWVEGGWDVGDAVVLSRALAEHGCDIIHVSSAGLDPRQQIRTGPGYQVEFSARIRREAGVATVAVGQITEPLQAETILQSGQADMVAIARGFLWNPRWAWHAALALGEEIALPGPYQRSHPSVRASPFVTRK